MSSSVTPIFDAFVEFCFDQPMNRPIDHTCYGTCAVGQFWVYNYPDGFNPDNISAYGLMHRMVDELRLVSWDLMETFSQTLGNARGNGNIPTFGHLSAWLHHFQHQVKEAAQ